MHLFYACAYTVESNVLDWRSPVLVAARNLRAQQKQQVANSCQTVRSCFDDNAPSTLKEARRPSIRMRPLILRQSRLHVDRIMHVLAVLAPARCSTSPSPGARDALLSRSRCGHIDAGSNTLSTPTCPCPFYASMCRQYERAVELTHSRRCAPTLRMHIGAAFCGFISA